ncbi:MAG: hypothetical protein ACI81R_002501 [Bradymonadia bacterium]
MTIGREGLGDASDAGDSASDVVRDFETAGDADADLRDIELFPPGDATRDARGHADEHEGEHAEQPERSGHANANGEIARRVDRACAVIGEQRFAKGPTERERGDGGERADDARSGLYALADGALPQALTQLSGPPNEQGAVTGVGIERGRELAIARLEGIRRLAARVVSRDLHLDVYPVGAEPTTRRARAGRSTTRRTRAPR